MIKLKSMLSYQEIFDYKETPNILIYENLKIPCISYFDRISDDKGYIRISVDKVYLTLGFFEKLYNNKKNIMIDNNKFYLSNHKFNDVKSSEKVTFGFELVKKESIEIVNHNLYLSCGGDE